MENIKIIETLSDGTQKELCISDVISRFLSDKVDYRKDYDIMIGMRGISKNIPCLYMVEPVGYEPHRITVLNDL